MSKAHTTDQPAVPPAPVPDVAVQPPQPVQPQYYQQYAAPAAPKFAVHPALELSLAVFSVLASVWLFVGALTGAIGLFGDRTPQFDTILSLLMTHLGGYTGVIVASLAGVGFAGAAFWLFRRLSAAIESDTYKATLQVGASIAVIKTIVLAITTVAVALTPLLTIQKGSSVGPVYLYDFLPLVIATAAFGFVAWYLLKLVGKKQVGGLLSTVLLIATGVVFVLGLVAVTVKSHDTGSSYSSSDSSTSQTESSRNSSGSRNDSGSSSSGKTSSECFDDYKKNDDLTEYSKCLQDVNSSSRSTNPSGRNNYSY